MPSWMRELLRQAPFRNQLFVYGAINDTLFYPLPSDQGAEEAATRAEPQWSSGDIRRALFDIGQNWLTGYDIVASYSFIDGMHFADEEDEQKMAAEFAELLKTQRGATKTAAAGEI